MYYCYFKKSLFSLIILFFMHSLIYASFPIEDINENAINFFFLKIIKMMSPPFLSIFFEEFYFFQFLFLAYIFYLDHGGEHGEIKLGGLEY